MTEGMTIGTITITVYLDGDGYEMVSSTVEGDHFPVITQLGALDLTRDTILHPEEDE